MWSTLGMSLPVVHLTTACCIWSTGCMFMHVVHLTLTAVQRPFNFYTSVLMHAHNRGLQNSLRSCSLCPEQFGITFDVLGILNFMLAILRASRTHAYSSCAEDYGRDLFAQSSSCSRASCLQHFMFALVVVRAACTRARSWSFYEYFE